MHDMIKSYEIIFLVESLALDNKSANHLLDLIKWLSFESSVEIPLPNDYKYIKSTLMKELMKR